MLEAVNSGSTALFLNENGRSKYFFVSYVAWIIDFQEMRNVIVIDGTFLRKKFEGVLLLMAAQDGKNQIFTVLFMLWTKNVMSDKKLCRCN